MFTIEEILNLAEQLEKNGENVYRQALSLIREKEVAELVRWMADEENRHAQWFSQLKAKWASESQNPLKQEVEQSMLADMLGRQSFSLKEVDFKTIKDERALLAVFIEFEEDTILFYEMLEPFVQDDLVKIQLDRIIEEEHEHIRRITEHLRQLETASRGL